MRKNFLYDTPDLGMEAFQCVTTHMGGMPRLFSGGGGSAPAADPLIGLSMLKNATNAEEALNFFKSAYNDQQPRLKEYADLQRRVSESQISGMDLQQQIAGDMYGRYRAKYAPVEDQLIEDARTYDSADKVDARVGRGLTDLRQQQELGREMMGRNLGRYGVSLNPTALGLINSRLAGQDAAAAAGLSNNIRTQSELTGMQLRSGVAGLGRGVQTAGLQSTAAAGAAGNAALSSAGSTLDQYRQQSGLMGRGYDMAQKGYNNAANIGNNLYRNQLAAWQFGDQSDAGMWQAAGTIVGMAGAAAISSKEAKQDYAKVDEKAALNGIKRTPVESWRYKGDPPDKRHVGPYAEDLVRELGHEVSPDGKSIDMISMNGVNMAAIKALSKEVDDLKSQLRGISMANGGKVHQGPGPVRGPGGPVDDKVPAMLSDGEYVIPADTAATIGKENLDKIVRKTHTPAAVQRRKKGIRK